MSYKNRFYLVMCWLLQFLFYVLLLFTLVNTRSVGLFKESQGIFTQDVMDKEWWLLTSMFITEIREPPDIAESNCVSKTWQEEVTLIVPRASLCLYFCFFLLDRLFISPHLDWQYLSESTWLGSNDMNNNSYNLQNLYDSIWPCPVVGSPSYVLLYLLMSLQIGEW